MPIEVFIPKMSDHMETGRIVKWLVKEGETVTRGQVLLELETDKVIAEVEAGASGVLQAVRAAEGDVVPVGKVIAHILRPNEMAAVPALGTGAASKSPPTQPVAPAVASSNGQPAQTVSINQPVRATPLARRVARDLKVDLRQVLGTGPRGIIRDSDVRKFAATPTTAFHQAAPEPAPKVLEPAWGAPAMTPPNSETAPLSTIQRLTGQRLAESFAQAPHFYLQMSVEMSRALEVLETSRERILQAAGERASLTILLVKVLGVALRHHPRVNAFFEKDHLRLLPQVNVGVAMAGETGLVVPVVREADRKSLIEITRDLKLYQAKVKDRRLTVDDLADGTFTLSNLGMYGVEAFSAIINPPQSGILAVGRVMKTPVGLPDDSIALRPLLALTLSVDHRALDGVQAAQFLGEIKQLLEQPYYLL